MRLHEEKSWKSLYFTYEIHNDKPQWKLVGEDNDPKVIENFESYLSSLEMQ